MSVRPESLKISIIDVRDGQCRWIEGQPSGGCCGHPTRGGSSYCEFHHAIAYQPVKVEQEVRR